MKKLGGRYVAIMHEARLTDTCYRWADPRLQKEFRRLQRHIPPHIRQLAYERIVKIRAELSTE